MGRGAGRVIGNHGVRMGCVKNFPILRRIFYRVPGRDMPLRHREHNVAVGDKFIQVPVDAPAGTVLRAGMAKHRANLPGNRIAKDERTTAPVML